jgi:hypothetical protein
MFFSKDVLTKIAHAFAGHLMPLKYLTLFYVIICLIGSFSNLYPDWFNHYFAIFMASTLVVHTLQSVIMFVIIVLVSTLPTIFIGDPQIFLEKSSSSIVKTYSVLAILATILIAFHYGDSFNDIWYALSILLACAMYVDLFLKKRAGITNIILMRSEVYTLPALGITALIAFFAGAFLIFVTGHQPTRNTMLYFCSLFYFLLKPIWYIYLPQAISENEGRAIYIDHPNAGKKEDVSKEG